MEEAPGGVAIVFVLLSVFVLAAVPPASADTRSLDPGIPFEVTKHVDSMAYVNYSWTVTPSGASIHFVVLDPHGAAVVDTTASSYDGFRLSLDSGTYKFRWTNNESSPITLNYNVTTQSTGIDDAERIFDTVFLGLLVGAVVVVIIVVLIIVVVMRGGRRTQPPVTGTPAQHAPPGEAPSPYVPGMCPRCGSPFDSQHTFCPKCGHRVR
jgi:hypothetical protein